MKLIRLNEIDMNWAEGQDNFGVSVCLVNPDDISLIKSRAGASLIYFKGRLEPIEVAETIPIIEELLK